jgi:hypothetical protein
VSFHRNRFLLSVPIDGATDNNCLLVYNTLTRSWHGRWTNLDPICFAVSSASDEIRINMGRADGKVLKWLDIEDESLQATFEDSGAAIGTLIETRAMTFREAFSPKQPFGVEAEFFQSKAEASLDLLLDDSSSALIGTFETRTPVRTLPTTLPTTLLPSGTKRRSFSVQHLANFREAKARVYSSGGKLSLRGVNMSAFLETLRVEQ